MNLYRASWRHLRWFASVWRQLIRHTPFAAPMTAGTLLISQLAQVVAFLLPLKVILLLGGNGIPRYFQGFVTMETRSLWIVLLCAGAVLLFAVSQFMDWLADRQSQRGALVVLDNARKITLFNDQDAGVREQYRRLCEAMAEGAMALVGFGVGLYLFPTLFAFLLLVVVVMAGATLGLASVGSADYRHRVERWLNANSKGLLRILGSSGFLLGFLFLVFEFYRLSELNLLIAIISLILSRRIFQSLTNFVNGQIRLAEQRQRVDALFFHERQLQSDTSRGGQRFWELFAPAARLARSREWIRARGGRDAVASSRWWDGGQSNVAWFALAEESSVREASTREPSDRESILEKIYLPRQRSQGNHETYLLERIDLGAVHAPRLLDKGQIEEFLWLHLLCPPGAAVPRERRGEMQRRILFDLWCYVPPEEIVDSYLRSHPPLWARVDRALVDKVLLAAEEPAERELVEAFQRRLEEMQRRLKAVPLHIYNPDVSDRNILLDEQDSPCVLCWGRWSLEPIGAGATPRYLVQAREGEMMGALRQRRKISQKVTDRDFLLAAGLHELERLIERQQYRRALRHMEHVLQDVYPPPEATPASAS
ncbi:hypothetical protein BTW08_10570 [Salinicola sp. MH3R3-1]|uniref:hypothetical protein n=1 Tax=Salinicola sp. MH3R3-1 TaxID=1928762 RepID=UPI00094EE664|nr:hypothetical protein [Salinicola sp. MH3R3-1]OLO07796.1 hypothetical protein BTW08_10570 [Salinicola sp. MH3R3-1]